MSKNISTIIIAKNEVDRIARCIESVRSVSDDIIVIDNGSIDGTVEKAEKSGARVVETEWKGYGATKNYGHELAKYDWILSLDADEYLSEDLTKELETLQLKNNQVYALNRRNIYLGKEIKYSGWNPDWVLRLFDRTKVKWNDNLVHEKLVLSEGMTTQRLNNLLFHTSYRSLEDHKAKIEKYAKLRARVWKEKNNPPGILKKAFGPFWKGFTAYILKFGFLDGKAGWQIAKMNVYLVKRQLHYYDELTKN